MNPLPVDAHLPEIADALVRHRAVIVVAEPGAGKTTRVPPALLANGPLLLLQPRRSAARAIAERIAAERSWTLGRDVGWQIRLDRRFSTDTRLLVVTEGILTARLQQDPLLSDFRTIVLDEFHERSIHADLGIALAAQAWRARDDLRLVVMSATIDADRVAAFLDDAPVVRVAGSTHPVHVTYAPDRELPDAVVQVLPEAFGGSVLCFLPGAFEIQRACDALRPRLPPGIEIVPLHGSLSADEQARALAPSAGGVRRVIAATNVAETSVTVPGVRAVIDTGLQKVARYDSARAIDSLSTERVTQDAADQRAGRAGRLGPGLVRRLWDARDRLRPHREADIHRIDLSSAVLEIAAWGGDATSFAWFETPDAEAIAAARQLLERLGVLDGGALTAIGRVVHRLPLHPRLARVVVAGGGDRRVCQAAALLAERTYTPGHGVSTTSDLLSALDDWNRVPGHVQQVARDIERAAAAADLQPRRGAGLDDRDFCRAVLAGYPDRVAARRAPGSDRVRLSTGTGAVIARDSGVHSAELLVALDLRSSAAANDADHRIRLASMVEREWLTATSRDTVHRLDDAGVVRAVVVERYDAIELSQTPVKPDTEIAARLLTEAWFDRPLTATDALLVRRLTFAGLGAEVKSLVAAAAYGARALSEVRLVAAIPPETLRTLDRDAPDRLDVPSGRSVALEYGEDGTVSAAVKLQELFGLAETPTVGRRREPVVLSLLAPNGRPVQVTRDLRSFWNRTYLEVRKELRGRYPKHPWPEDPWTAPPTARTKRPPRG